jgi:hypothetical protein
MASGNKRRSTSPGARGGPSAAPKSPRALVIGIVCSVAILGAALGLQAAHSWILKTPTQWLAIAALPALIGLVLGGYLGGFSFAGVELKAPPLKPVEYVEPGVGSSGVKPASRPDWTTARAKEYERTHDLVLVHTFIPSTHHDQKYDVSIYLMRHLTGLGRDQVVYLADVKRAEFYFGPYWGERIFPAINDGDVIGVNTSAWGAFLATCLVTFVDDSDPVVLYRYIDFEMASAS